MLSKPVGLASVFAQEANPLQPKWPRWANSPTESSVPRTWPSSKLTGDVDADLGTGHKEASVDLVLNLLIEPRELNPLARSDRPLQADVVLIEDLRLDSANPKIEPWAIGGSMKSLS